VLTLFAFMGRSGQIYLFIELCGSADVYFRCICPTQKSSSFTESPGSRRRYRLIRSTHTTNPKRPVTFHRLSVIPRHSSVLKIQKICSSDNSGRPITCQAVRCHTAEYLDVHCAYVMSYLKLLNDVEVSNVT
jgi:hypothetical protein